MCVSNRRQRSLPHLLHLVKKGVNISKVGHSHLAYRSFTRFDENEFLNDFSNAPFDKVYNRTDPDEALATWYTVFLKVLDEHAPEKKRRIKYSFRPEWLTLEIKYWMQCVTEMIFLN